MNTVAIYSSIYLNEILKFMKKLLIILFFYLFTNAIGITDSEFHLLMFVNFSILFFFCIWLFPIPNSIIFYLESDQHQKKTFLRLSINLFVSYYVIIFLFFYIFTHLQKAGAENRFYNSDLSMILSFLSLICYIILVLASRINFIKNFFNSKLTPEVHEEYTGI